MEWRSAQGRGEVRKGDSGGSGCGSSSLAGALLGRVGAFGRDYRGRGFLKGDYPERGYCGGRGEFGGG